MMKREQSSLEGRASGSRIPAVVRLSRSAIRIFFVFLGVNAVAWGTYALPIFTQQAPIERVASHVIDGDPFKIVALANLIPAVQTIEEANICRPAAVHAAAIIRLRLAEQITPAGDINGGLTPLRDSIRSSLRCSPADPFLWLVLFSVENTLSGFSSGNIEYLRMSYLLGPNEGWIGVKRNRISLAVFEQLPPDLALMVVDEFGHLLGGGFVSDSVSAFTGPGWRIRGRLLERLRTVDEKSRKAFARALYSDGYDIDVPGIKNPELRPWH